MKRLLAVGLLFGALAIPVVSAAAPHAHSAGVRHCGSIKFGTDGNQPGPGNITAKNVSCWFARATALLGPGPGWHWFDNGRLVITCKPSRGNGVVIYTGESSGYPTPRATHSAWSRPIAHSACSGSGSMSRASAALRRSRIVTFWPSRANRPSQRTAARS
jgi:hypothetical protein